METFQNTLQGEMSSVKDLASLEKTIDELVLDAQRGNAEAFGKIYDYYVQKVYRYIYFKVDKDEALDLTESVFLKAWEHLKSYKKRNHAFSAWLFRIAHNLVVDFHRFRKDSLPLDHTIEDNKKEHNPEFTAEQSLSREMLKVALNKMKGIYRQVLILKYINDLDNQEIAQILGKSEGGLRVLKHRALQELKKVLQDMGLKY